GGNGGKVGIKVDAGEPAAESKRGNARRADAAERIEHQAARLAANFDATCRNFRREGREMPATVGPGVDRPDIARGSASPVISARVARAIPPGIDDLRRMLAVLCRAAAGMPPVTASVLGGWTGGVRNPDRVKVEPVAP